MGSGMGQHTDTNTYYMPPTVCKSPLDEFNARMI